MNNLLSKRLLCGVIATSFFLINCQKAPNRPVKPSTDGNGKIAATAKTVDCTPDMITALTERTTLRADIDNLTKDPTKLGAPEKENLQKLINDLYAKSKAAYDLIKAAKVATAAADSCKQPDPQNAKTPKVNMISAMSDADRITALGVQKITGQSNDILDNVPVILMAGKVLNISADMAAMLSDEKNLNGAKMLVEGQIVDGGAALEALKADKKKSACIVTLTDKKAVAEGAKATITSLSAARVDEKSKRVTVDLVFGIQETTEGNRLMNMSCIIADASDANSEMLKSLGSLLSTKAPAAEPSMDVDAGQAGDAGSAGDQGAIDQGAAAGGTSGTGTVSGTPVVSGTPEVSGTTEVTGLSAQERGAADQRAIAESQEALRLMNSRLGE